MIVIVAPDHFPVRAVILANIASPLSGDDWVQRIASRKWALKAFISQYFGGLNAIPCRCCGARRVLPRNPARTSRTGASRRSTAGELVKPSQRWT